MARKSGSHSQITGPRIKQAALRLFAAEGYAAVSMRQIAKDVGVQVGTLYRYTPDKQALLFDLMESHMTGLLAAFDAEPRASSASERLRAFTRFHILYHLDRPDEVFIAYMELRNLTPENFSRIESLRRDYESRLRDILDDGVATGAFEIADSRLATLAIIAMLTGVNTWFRQSGRLSPEGVWTTYWEMVRRSVGAT